MRHGKKFNHLGRKPAHRQATLSNMATSLILNKRINTTVAKAKALRKYVEPIITRSKDDTTHSRRMVFKYLQSKESVKELFGEVADKVATRPGGYTRIIKTGYRLGDNAEMCMMELVDFNELLLQESQGAKAKTRRSRRKKSGGSAKTETASVSSAAEVSTEEAVSEEVTSEEAIVEEVGSEQVEEASAQPDKEVSVEEPVAEETEVVEESIESEVVEEQIETETEKEEVVSGSEPQITDEVEDNSNEEVESTSDKTNTESSTDEGEEKDKED